MDKKGKLTSIEQYIVGVFNIILVLIPIIALCAGLVYTVLKATGSYQSVSWTGLVIFDTTCVLYLLISFVIVGMYKRADVLEKDKIYIIGKIYIAILMLIQWNFITYLIPSRDFWAYAVFFVMLAMSFLDVKYLLAIMAEILVSLIVSWIIIPDIHLPVRDELFIPDMVIRCVFIFLAFVTMIFLTLLIEKKLARELERIAEYDTLTLLHNRHSMEKIVKKVKKNGDEKDEEFSVIMCDLDLFKKINDQYGHECGDLVLKKVAGTIISNIKEKDFAFRYGGEEMLIVIRASKEIALQTAERIRREVEENFVDYNGEIVKITITMGLAENEKGVSIEDIIKKADEKLYFGKQNGRNQITA